MTGLSVDHLSLTFGSRLILDDVSLSATPGELVALVGPNGAGKTSLLRSIVGLVEASGVITLGDQQASRLSANQRARRLGYLPQGHALHWPIPVRDVVALGRYPLGVRDPARLSAVDQAAVDAALQATDTTQFRERSAMALSGGERARVALARVLALEAPILLADEPTASLDPRHQIEVMECLANIARGGAVVIVITHDLLLASRYCDRVIVMAQGRIHADGAPQTALAATVLSDVFRVSPAIFVHEGRTLAVPWRTV
ncbi:ABC transporter ATP-binding protein [Candidatus Raskinella chloraquaticus]|jgi:iron complex transport system ATP-binding protein|uniref:ABC transporter ATP-binding protein n=1 Tax=Candidatus Raskinella chloraquaticus TaxID=1951219 RepID=UPI00366EC749